MIGRTLPIFLLTLLAAGLMMPGLAHAEVVVNCDKYVGLTNHIAGCVRQTLDSAVGAFFDPATGVYPIFARAIKATMIIAVAVFGVMAAFGMLERAGRDTIMLLIKIAMVSYFTLSSEDLYNTSMLMMDSAGKAVVSYVPMTGKSDNTEGSDFSQIKCMKDLSAEQGNPRAIYIFTLNRVFTTEAVGGPWLALDCIIDSVIGIRVATKDPIGGVKKSYNETINESEKGPSRGLLYFFFSSMQSSVMGLLLAVIGLMFIWGMLNLIIKALFIYLAGYLGLAVMMIFAPLFIPMVLFQSTKSYFDKWIKLIISFSLQPIIILVFVAFSIAAVDLAIFSGEYSVMYRLTGDASKQKNFSLNYYLTCLRNQGTPTQCVNPPAVAEATAKSIIEDTSLTYGKVKADLGDVGTKKATDGTIVGGLDESDCIDSLLKANPNDTPAEKARKDALRLKCDASYPLQIFKKNINWAKLAQARVPAVTIPDWDSTNGSPKPEDLGEQIAKESFAAILFAAIVVFVMAQLLKVVPMVAYDLIGDFGQAPNLAKAGGALPGRDNIKAAMRDMVEKRT